MSQAYYRKWRPQGWDEVVGQEHVIRTLRSALGQGNIAHAYLFSGPRGTGKTTTARIIAKAVNCLAEDQSARPCNQCANCLEINEGRFLDLIEIDAASNTSVDDVRDLREKINYSPNKGRYKVYIIDEVHMLSNAAFNALLKTLEEPPAHAIFVLATTEVHKIPATVLSRCQRHEFRRIPLNFIQALLKEIAEKESIKVEASALTAIARQATGSMRDAVSLLDQLASTGAEVTLEFTRQVLGTAAGERVFEVVEALLAEDSGKGISLVNQALDGGSDPRQFGRQMVDALRAVLMVRMGNAGQLEITPEDLEKLKNYADRFPLDKLLNAIQAFDRAALQASLGWQPGLQLELAVARSVNFTIEKQADEVKEEPRAQPKITKQPQPFKAKEINAVHPVSAEQKQPTAEIAETHEQPVEKKESISEVDEKIPQTPTEPARAAAEGDLARIKDSWKEIRAAAKELSAETGALLNSCRSVTMRKGRLVLGFASELLRSKMENGHNQDNARQAIKQIVGVDAMIDCRVAGKDEATAPDDLDIDHDGVLGAALSLGGKITKKE